MADEATPAGDDQPQEADEDQPVEETPDERDERIAALEEEVRNTNAYVTRLQQQQAQQPKADPQTPEVTAVYDDQTGQYLTPEQVRLIKRAAGNDVEPLKKELEELRKEREEERKRADFERFQSQMDAVSKEFPADKGYPKVDPQKLGQFMEQNGIFNPRAAYKEMHESAIFDIRQKAAAPKASPGDRPDATEEPKLSREDYLKKLTELSLDGDHEGRRKLMLEHGALTPDNQ